MRALLNYMSKQEAILYCYMLLTVSLVTNDMFLMNVSQPHLQEVLGQINQVLSGLLAMSGYRFGPFAN